MSHPPIRRRHSTKSPSGSCPIHPIDPAFSSFSPSHQPANPISPSQIDSALDPERIKALPSLPCPSACWSLTSGGPPTCSSSRAGTLDPELLLPRSSSSCAPSSTLCPQHPPSSATTGARAPTAASARAPVAKRHRGEPQEPGWTKPQLLCFLP